jgi:F0F1-type ATP synthase membrane subunit c/vacuolar-type H+-ATPase subunit K
MGAAKGIGNIGGSAMEAIARQPEAGGRIGTNMIISAISTNVTRRRPPACGRGPRLPGG